MDFMTDEELDGYFVLILFMLKMKTPCPQKNVKDFGSGKYSKREERTEFTTV